MSILTQGTQLFWIKSPTAVQVVAATNISGISAKRDSLETTDLTSTAKTFISGLPSPGSAQFSIQFDPSNAVHADLQAAYKTGTVLKWALGMSDGTAPPTATAGAFTLPATRTFLTFDGFIEDMSFDFKTNSIVESQLSLQISGMPTLTVKV